MGEEIKLIREYLVDADFYTKVETLPVSIVESLFISVLKKIFSHDELLNDRLANDYVMLCFGVIFTKLKLKKEQTSLTISIHTHMLNILMQFINDDLIKHEKM